MFRKISISFFAVVLLAVLMGAQAFAAYGEVQFSDPQTKAGEEIEITAKMTCGGVLIGDGELTLKYDPEYLEFVEGTGSKDESEGSVTIFNAGTGSETELDYTITFRALKEGETVIEVTDYESYLWDNSTLNLTLGTSTVTIAEGDGSTDTDSKSKSKVKGDGPEVSIDGVKYNVVNDIPPVAIPVGFSQIETSLNGETVNALQQDTSGQQAFYLTDGKDPRLFLYFGEDGTFSPLELVEISDTAYLIFLPDDGGATVPKGFDEVTLTFNDNPFPAWQNPSQADYYLVYGLNNSGEKAMYLYDKQDDTYQRFNPDVLKQKPVAKKSSKSSGILGAILDFIGNHLKPFLIAVGALLLFMLIWALVLCRKVHNRNVEIDDLYDELDGKKAGSVAGPGGTMTDDFSGVMPFGDDFFGDDDFDAYNDTFEFDDDDDFLDNLTDTMPVKLTDTLANHKLINEGTVTRRKAKKTQVKPLSNPKFHVDSDDTFKMDFIDFDE